MADGRATYRSTQMKKRADQWWWHGVYIWFRGISLVNAIERK